MPADGSKGRVLLVGPHPDLRERIAAYLERLGFGVDHILQWFQELPRWESGAPDLIIAHAETPNDRFGISQLLGLFREVPPTASIATGPSTVPGCSYELRYPFHPAALEDLLEEAVGFLADARESRLPPPPSVSLEPAPVAPPRPRVVMPAMPKALDPLRPAYSAPSDSEPVMPPPESIDPEFAEADLDFDSRAAEVREVPEPAPFEAISDDDDDVTPLGDDALLELEDVEEAELLDDDLVEEVFETEALTYEGGAPEDQDDPEIDGGAWGRHYRGPAGAMPETASVDGSPDGSGVRIWKKVTRELPLEGELIGFRLADVLHDCAQFKRTGILHLRRESHEKRVYFDAGVPVWADSALREETLGAYLLKRGVVSREELQAAFDVMRSTGKRLGEVLMQMKVLRPGEAYAYLRQHIQGKVAAAFGWFEGRYRFEALPGLPESITCVSMTVPSLVLQGMRAHFSPYHLPYELAEIERASAFRLKRPAYDDDELGLSKSELDVRRALEAGATAASLMPGLGAQSDQVLGIAYALYALQVLGFSDRPAAPKVGQEIEDISGPLTMADDIFTPASQASDDFMEQYMRLRPLNCFELLGVSAAEEDDDVFAGAFQALRSRLHPDCFTPDQIADLGLKVEELWAQIELAYRTLASAEGRAKYRRSLGLEAEGSGAEEVGREQQGRALLAEAHFHAGLEALEAEAYERARDEFDKALASAPTDPTYLAHRAWAMYHADPQKHRQHAIAELNTARAIDSSYAGVSYFLGRICLDDEALQISRGYFEMALRADPDHAEARRYLNHVRSRVEAAQRPKVEPEKPGRIGRLFRRKK